jgi:hypothetical protein
MYVFELTDPFRDSSLDNMIIYHELTHGTSSRAVGGPSNVTGLQGLQSGGLGEGWSDFMSLWMTQKPNDRRGDPRPLGNWVLGFPENGPGIRRAVYDSTIGRWGNPNTYDHPQTFNDFDPTGHDAGLPGPYDDIYTVGEIWCQTLWDLNWAFIEKHGYDDNYLSGTGGNNIALQVIVQGMAFTPTNPTLLNARDAILAADTALNGSANHLEIWTTFAGRGMGQYANDGAHHDSTAVREDYIIPDVPFVPPPGGGTLRPGNGRDDNRYEPNNTSDQAHNLGNVNGQLLVQNLKIYKKSGQKDRDWFQFQVSQGGSTTVRIAMAKGADLDIFVYRNNNGTHEEIGRSARAQKGGQEAVTFNSQNGTQYLVHVIGRGNSAGNYGMQIVNA